MNPIVKSVPNGWSENAADLINKLIIRKDDQRLGKNGISEIKNHVWFDEINWIELENHRLEAPFIPVNIEDYFDESYLDSFEKSPKLLNDIENAKKILRNNNVQKQFKDYYFDKEKSIKLKSKISTNMTSTTKPVTTNNSLS